MPNTISCARSIKGKIVVLHSVGIGGDGKTFYNINGDDYAMAVAIALKAKRLILVTNVPGVLDKHRNRIPAIDYELAAQLIAEGVSPAAWCRS